MTALIRALGLLLLAVPLPFVALLASRRPAAALANAVIWIGGVAAMVLAAAGPGLAVALLAILHAWWGVLWPGQVRTSELRT